MPKRSVRRPAALIGAAACMLAAAHLASSASAGAGAIPAAVTQSQHQSPLQPQARSQLETTLLQAKREMREAMALSYAINEAGGNWEPAEALTRVNSALGAAEETVRRGIEMSAAGGQLEYHQQFQTLGFRIAGTKYLNKENYRAAREELLKAWELASRNADSKLAGVILNNLAYARFFSGEKNQALAEIGRVIEVARSHQDSNYPMYVYNLGWFYLHSGDFARARTEFTRAAEESQRGGKAVWEAMSRINGAVAGLLLNRNEDALLQLTKAAKISRTIGSTWYEQMAAYYLPLAETRIAGPKQRSTTSGLEEALLALRAELTTVPSQLPEPTTSKVTQITVGKQSGNAGTLTVVPVRLTYGLGPQLAMAELEVSYPVRGLEFKEANSPLPAQVAIKAGPPIVPSRGSARVVIQFSVPPKSKSKSLPAGLMAFLAFKIKHTADAGDIPLKTLGKATLVQEPPVIVPLVTLDGTIKVLPPRACYIRNH